MLKRKLLSVRFITVLLFQLFCNGSLINRALAAFSAARPLIIAFHRPNEEELLKVFDEIVHDFEVFRDNPTSSNYQNAMRLIDGTLSRNVFGFNQNLLAVITAARALFAAILPAGVTMASNERVIVKINEEDVKELERRVKALKAEVRR